MRQDFLCLNLQTMTYQPKVLKEISVHAFNNIGSFGLSADLTHSYHFIWNPMLSNLFVFLL